MSKKTKTKAAAPAQKPAVKRKRKRKMRIAAAVIDPQTVAVMMGSLGQAVGSLAMAPGARLAINIGPHGSHLDYIKPLKEPAPQDDLADAFVRGFHAGKHAGTRDAEFTESKS